MGLLDIKKESQRVLNPPLYGIGGRGLLEPLPSHTYSGPANTPNYIGNWWDKVKTGEMARQGLQNMIMNPEQTAMDWVSPLGKVAGMIGATAYHGSPYKFDKFRLDRIGTGEGAQAYGHGLYFAENPNVAGSYIHSNPSAIPTVGITPEVKKALEEMDYLGYDSPAQALNHLRSTPNWQMEVDLRGVSPQAVDTVARHISQNPRGSVYKVEIPDEAVNKMLDWDKPLSQQPEILKEIANQVGLKDRNAVGVNLHESVKQWLRHNPEAPAKYKNMNPDAAVAEYLREAGIPGIKYLDQGSRNSGKPYWNVIDKSTGKTVQAVLDKPTNLPSKYKVEGPINPTYNFVVFDENLPKILERK